MAVKPSLGSGCPPWGLCARLSSSSVPSAHIRVTQQIFRGQSFVSDCRMPGGVRCPWEHAIGVKLIFKTDSSTPKEGSYLVVLIKTLHV